MGEKFTLNWHTFSTHGQELFKNLLETQDFADLILISEDQKQFKVHKFILSACSTVFREIITKNPLNTAIYLRGIHHEELESIVQFIYLGVATFSNERINELLKVAKDLDVKVIGKHFVEDNEENGSLNDNQSFENNESDETESKGASTSSGIPGQDINIDYFCSQMLGVKKSFQCLLCDYQSSHKHKLKSHMKFQHEGNKQLCKECDYKAPTLSNLKQHIKSKHEGIRYACQQCDFQAITTNYLQQHINSKHEGIKYICKQCDYRATSTCNLQKHINSKHEGIKYPCKQCDYQATTTSNLQIHIKKHEGFIYHCKQCNYQANFSSGLNQHVKAKHS